MGLVSRAELPAAGGGTGGIKTGGLNATVSCGGPTVVVVVVTLGGTPVVVVVVTFGRSLGGLDDSCCPELATLLTVPRYFTISCARLAMSCLLITGSSSCCTTV